MDTQPEPANTPAPEPTTPPAPEPTTETPPAPASENTIEPGFLALAGLLLLGGFYVMATSGVFGDESLLAAARRNKTQSLAVQVPNGGETLFVGTTTNLTWTGGKSDWIVSLYLINEERTHTVSTISHSARNTGSYAWQVPSNIPAGNYYLRLGCENCKPNVKNRVDFSDMSFHISETSKPPTLAVNFISATEDVVAYDGADNDQGIFKIKVRAQAIGGTVYIATSTSATTAGALQNNIHTNLFKIEKNGVATTSQTASALVFTTSGGASYSPNANIMLEGGETTDITFTATRANVGNASDDGLYRMVLSAIAWSANDALIGYEAYQASSTLFKTDYVNVN